MIFGLEVRGRPELEASTEGDKQGERKKDQSSKYQDHNLTEDPSLTIGVVPPGSRSR